MHSYYMSFDCSVQCHFNVVSYLKILIKDPYRKVHGSNMGPIWGRQDPGGPHVGPINFAIWGYGVSYVDWNLDLYSTD